jgi:hypothetical protein
MPTKANKEAKHLTPQQQEDRKRPYAVVIAKETPAGKSYKILRRWSNKEAALGNAKKGPAAAEAISMVELRRAEKLLTQAALQRQPAEPASEEEAFLVGPTIEPARNTRPPAPAAAPETLAAVLRRGVHASLTDHLLYTADNDHLREAIYGLQLEMQHPTRYAAFVDARCFVPIEPTLSYPELRDMDQQELVDALKDLRRQQAREYQQALEATYSLHYAEGREFYRCCRHFSVTGYFRLTVGKVAGWISEKGGFAGFNESRTASLCDALRLISHRIPDQDDAFNVGHTEWSVEDNTVYLTQRCAETAELARWQRFFDLHVLPRERQLGTDLLVLDVSENFRAEGQPPAYVVRVVMQWS